MIQRVFALLLLSCCVCLAGCRRDDRPVVVLYVSADDHVAAEVIRAFEAQHKIRVRMVGDTEAKKTTGLVERLRAEKDAARADVFWSSEVFMTIELAAEGVFVPFDSAATKDWPAKFKGDSGLWYGFGSRARVLAYSPSRVKADELPQTWMELAQERFRDRLAMADPRFGTTGGHLGAMKAYWDREVMPGYFAAFALGLAENNVRILASGNAGVVDAITKGEVDFGMTDTDDVWAAQARGLDVKLIYPRHSLEEESAGGTLLIPNTVAKVKGGPNPAAADQLIEFLLSEQVERLLAQSTSHNIPMRASLAKEFAEYAVNHPLRIDFAAAAKDRTTAIDQFMRAVNEVRGKTAGETDDAR